jgi:hypothetical protein
VHHYLALLLAFILQNHHTAWAKAYVLLRFTYNKGLTNLEDKGTQQDITDKKKRLQGYAG